MSTGQLNLGQVKLGDNADESKNFLIKVPAVADGTLVIERGNGTDVLSIDASGKVTFTAADNQLPLGVGQTWQDMLSVRGVNDTYYTNDTGRPIQVSIRIQQSGTGIAYVHIDGVLIGGGQMQSVSGSYTLTFIVPAGSQYKCTRTSNTLLNWSELR